MKMNDSDGEDAFEMTLGTCSESENTFTSFFRTVFANFGAK